MERYQLIIFATVVGALLILGFFFGRWLHGLLPSGASILDALSAWWARMTSMFRGGGDTLFATGSPVDVEVDSPLISDGLTDAEWCTVRGEPANCLGVS